MSTVIRLKRRAIEEPLEGVILNCKKLRTDIVDDTTSDQNTDTTKLLKFSGTIKSQVKTNCNSYNSKYNSNSNSIGNFRMTVSYRTLRN